MKERSVFIGIFGKSNKGKSSLINAIANQQIAIVSPEAGTTTDPVKKSMELFGIGPVVFVDTAGIDDESILGSQRMQKTIQTIEIINVAIIVLANNEFTSQEEQICNILQKKQIPFLFVHNKQDISPAIESTYNIAKQYNTELINVCSLNRNGSDNLITAISKIIPPTAYNKPSLIGDIIHRGDNVLLVMPQDAEAPTGRLILPQVQVIRDILDNHAVAICLQLEELSLYLENNTPQLIITDSQAFKEVNEIVPKAIPLTSFSIILARAKGNFNNYLKGTPHIMQLQNGDKILMLESCTHPIHCEDIGRIKLPNLIKKVTGKDISFDMVSALSPLPDLKQYSMAIQCGACMVTSQQVGNRIKTIVEHNIPVSNYGMSLAFLTNIFERATELFV